MLRKMNLWLSWDEVEEYAYLLDLELVPVLFKGIVNSKKELEDLVNKLVKEPSELGGVKEGVVVRVSKSFKDDVFTDNLQKWVRPNHVTIDSHWTKNWKRAKLVMVGDGDAVNVDLFLGGGVIDSPCVSLVHCLVVFLVSTILIRLVKRIIR